MPICQNTKCTYRLVIFIQLQVISTQLHAEYYCCNPLKTVDPFFALRPLPTHIHHFESAVGIVESSLVPSLVLKLKTELDDIQELILDTLSGCLRVEAFEALASGGVHILKEKLIHESVAIRSKAARALLGISVPLEGKNIVWEEEVIPELFNLLEDADDQVRANAAGALMNAAITTQGKYAALGANAIPCLLNLINDETSKVRLNSVKALTMLAEAPEGRKTLLSHVDQFKERMNDSSEAVSRAASIAVRVIEWKP
uniref:Uncharacterized protein n=1 Tax=Sphenodon punctatus TaxID=8508 RepID=A0A8D0HDU5_SPHPU